MAVLVAILSKNGCAGFYRLNALVRSACLCLVIASQSPPKSRAPKNSFRQPLQPDHPCPATAQKYSSFVFTEIVI
jgi:hypothetical protein